MISRFCFTSLRQPKERTLSITRLSRRRIEAGRRVVQGATPPPCRKRWAMSAADVNVSHLPITVPRVVGLNSR